MRKIKTKTRYIAIILFIILITPLFIRFFNNRRYINKNKETFATLQTIIEQQDFDRYVINLPKNKERLEAITQIYNNSDLAEIPFIRFEAVNGKEIDIRPYVSDRVYEGIMDIDKTKERYHHSQITRGAVGCYLSHLGIYEKIKQSSKPYALVLEYNNVRSNDI